MTINFTFTETVPAGASVIYLDASLLKRSYCSTAFYNVSKGLRRTKLNEAMNTGTAIHTFVRVAQTKDRLRALGEGMEVFKLTSADLSKFNAICSAYPGAQLLPPPIKIGEVLGIEFYFEVPWLSFIYNDVTYCVVVCGTMDHLSFVNGFVRIYDFKSTSNYKLDEVSASYKNDVQFDFYPWAIYKFGHRFLTLEMHNAARDFKMTTQDVLVYKGSTTAMPKWQPMAPVGCDAVRFEDFEHNIHVVLKRMIPVVVGAEPKEMEGWIANECPKCDFNDLCHCSAGMESTVLKTMYHVKKYKPKEHGESPAVGTQPAQVIAP